MTNAESNQRLRRLSGHVETLVGGGDPRYAGITARRIQIGNSSASTSWGLLLEDSRGPGKRPATYGAAARNVLYDVTATFDTDYPA